MHIRARRLQIVTAGHFVCMEANDAGLKDQLRVVSESQTAYERPGSVHRPVLAEYSAFFFGNSAINA